MAWKLHPSDEPMIDPFNAPDPVMPTDEPSLEAPDSSDGSERLRKHELQRRLARTGACGGIPWPSRARAPVLLVHAADRILAGARGRPGALIRNVLGSATDCTGYSR